MAIKPLSWREPFLAALRATGNAAESCRRAGVKTKTVYSARLNDTFFAEQYDQALAAAPPKKSDTWKPAFLAELRISGSISIAAERAGVRRETVARVRRKYPAFDRKCRSALAARDWKPRFIEKFRECGRADIAAQLVHIAPRTVRERKRIDPEFGRLYNDTKEAFERERLAKAAENTQKWMRTFILTLRRTCSVESACMNAGITLDTAYSRRKRDAEFARDWDYAAGIAAEGLQVAAFERAKKYSDGLLIMLLQAHKPELYRDGYNPLRFTQEQWDAMSGEEIAAVHLLQNAHWMNRFEE